MERRKTQGYSQEAFAEAMGTDRSTVGRWERGEVDPQPWQRPKLMRVLDVSAEELDGLLATEVSTPVALVPSPWLGNGGVSDGDEYDSDEYDALELGRRVQASDVGGATLARLERAFDELATTYPVTPPQDLLGRVRHYSAYVAQLLDAKKTLGEHRRLLVVGGWLSLLGATLHIDLKQDSAASARLQTAAALAQEAGHDEIHAWCYETTAWRVVIAGRLSRQRPRR